MKISKKPYRLKLKKLKKGFLILLFYFFPLISLAAGLVPCGGPGEEPCQLCHLFVLLNNIIVFLLTKIVPLAAVIFIIWGGLLFIVSAEDPGRIEKAKEIFKSVGWGLLLVFSSWLIVNLFLTLIGVAEWTNLKEWFKIKCP
jgi:di/tricarboxylate transporter